MLPLEWKGRYNASSTTESVKASWYGDSSQHGSKDRVSEFLDKHRPDIGAEEKALVLSVIRQVFRLKPEDRILASDLLEDEDFKGLMRLYGV